LTTTLVFLGAITLYAMFLLWYRGHRRPLTALEVEDAVALMAPHDDELRRQELTHFLAADDGRSFVMINLIQYREKPLSIDGSDAEKSSRATMGRYMKFMWPQLLKRACHPLLGGGAAAVALELWGLDEDAREWENVGLMRYRSRRDLVSIATHEKFRESHLFKEAAMEKTIAVPISPVLMLGGPQLVVPLVLFGAAGWLALFLS
jgi:hypothetical protein